MANTDKRFDELPELYLESLKGNAYHQGAAGTIAPLSSDLLGVVVILMGPISFGLQPSSPATGWASQTPASA